MHGLYTYDYGFRQYSALVPAWDRIDPLCEKYYHLSPYCYCAANPINNIDLFGLEIIYEGEDDDIEKIRQKIQYMSEGSSICKTVISKLESSKEIYTIHVGKSENSETSNYTPSTRSMKFNDKSGYITIGEEVYHAFQHEESKSTIEKYEQEGINVEFEAKTFSLLVCTEIGRIGTFENSLYDWFNYLDNNYNLSEQKTRLNLDQILNFELDYLVFSNLFVESSIKNQENDKNINSAYTNPSNKIPFLLMNLLRNR